MKRNVAINIETTQVCAFCKYWQDSRNSDILPHQTMQNVWQYNQKAKRMCMKKQEKTNAGFCCKNYSCKMLIMKSEPSENEPF